MVLKYATGEDITAGDEIVFRGKDGVVDFVVIAGDPATDWYYQEYGPGMMLVVEGMGSVYETHESALDPACGCEPLRLVARRAASAGKP